MKVGRLAVETMARWIRRWEITIAELAICRSLLHRSPPCPVSSVLNKARHAVSADHVPKSVQASTIGDWRDALNRLTNTLGEYEYLPGPVNVENPQPGRMGRDLVVDVSHYQATRLYIAKYRYFPFFGIIRPESRHPEVLIF